MTARARFQTIVRSYARHLAPQQALDPDAPLISLGLTSMDQVSLLVDLESALGFTMPEELLTQDTFATADSLWRSIGRLIEP